MIINLGDTSGDGVRLSQEGQGVLLASQLVARDAAKQPTMNRTGPQPRIIWFKSSVRLSLRNIVLNIHMISVLLKIWAYLCQNMQSVNIAIELALVCY